MGQNILANESIIFMIHFVNEWVNSWSDIDCLLYCEHRLNLRHKENVNDFKQMFQREIACTAVAAHNVHEWQQAGRVQEGGTGAICFGEATGFIRKVG